MNEERAARIEEAARNLVEAMETCHVCGGTVLVESEPIHCEDCSSDCEDHAEPDCTALYIVHMRLKKSLSL